MKPLRVSSGGTALTISFTIAWIGLAAPLAHAAKFQVDSTQDGADSRPGDGVCEMANAARGCSLRAAIQEANALAAAGRREPSSIELPAGVFLLTRAGLAEDAALVGDLDINTRLHIRGAGAARTIIDGGSLDRVFDIAAAPIGAVADIAVSLVGLTIRGGYSDEAGGGGVRFASPLTLQDTVVRDNATAGSGGGLASSRALGAHPRLTVIDSVVSHNAARLLNRSGGGIDAASVTLTRTHVSRDRAESTGTDPHLLLLRAKGPSQGDAEAAAKAHTDDMTADLHGSVALPSGAARASGADLFDPGAVKLPFEPKSRYGKADDKCP